MMNLVQLSLGDSHAPRQRPFRLALLAYPAGYEFPLPFGGWHSLLGVSRPRYGVPPRLRLAYCWSHDQQTTSGLPCFA